MFANRRGEAHNAGTHGTGLSSMSAQKESTQTRTLASQPFLERLLLVFSKGVREIF